MKLYTNATIKITEKNTFDNDKGETIEFYSAYLKDDEDNVLKINSGKHDFSEFEGKEGMAILNARDDGGRIKLSLVEFREDATIQA